MGAQTLIMQLNYCHTVSVLWPQNLRRLVVLTHNLGFCVSQKNSYFQIWSVLLLLTYWTQTKKIYLPFSHIVGIHSYKTKKTVRKNNSFSSSYTIFKINYSKTFRCETRLLVDNAVNYSNSTARWFLVIPAFQKIVKEIVTKSDDYQFIGGHIQYICHIGSYIETQI